MATLYTSERNEIMRYTDEVGVPGYTQLNVENLTVKTGRDDGVMSMARRFRRLTLVPGKR